MIDAATLQDLLGKWWWSYDAGNFDVLDTLLTDDTNFKCRTDTGQAEWEDFVRADITGRERVMEWQTDHRRNSPYPLRHHGTNLHITARPSDDEVTFTSYILVTQTVNMTPTPIPGGVVHGAARLVDGGLKISALEVVLDTVDSGLFSEVHG